MSTVILPIFNHKFYGKITAMLKDVLTRIQKRLDALDLKAAPAAKKAGLSDSAIRNMQRAVASGKEGAGASTTTLEKLAPVLKTSVGWLLTGEGPEAIGGGMTARDRLKEKLAQLEIEDVDVDDMEVKDIKVVEHIIDKLTPMDTD